MSMLKERRSALIHDSKQTSNTFIFAKLQISSNKYKSILEEETDVDVEGSVAVLLVEATCVLKRNDEVLVHDETKACTS